MARGRTAKSNNSAARAPRLVPTVLWSHCEGPGEVLHFVAPRGAVVRSLTLVNVAETPVKVLLELRSGTGLYQEYVEVLPEEPFEQIYDRVLGIGDRVLVQSVDAEEGSAVFATVVLGLPARIRNGND